MVSSNFKQFITCKKNLDSVLKYQNNTFEKIVQHLTSPSSINEENYPSDIASWIHSTEEIIYHYSMVYETIHSIAEATLNNHISPLLLSASLLLRLQDSLQYNKSILEATAFFNPNTELNYPLFQAKIKFFYSTLEIQFEFSLIHRNIPNIPIIYKSSIENCH